MTRRGIVLAVDGGNSKTDLALVTRGGALLALERGPTISHQQVPIEIAMQRLGELAARARRAARAGSPIEIGSYCLAGADFAGDVRLLRSAISGVGLSERVDVRNDAFGALRAGSPSGWGIVVICGAGVNAAGIAPDGRTARLAGIGDLSGDWGGGQGIGMAALAAAVRARDGRGPTTSLTEVVPRAFGLRRPADVSRAIYERRLDARRLEELPRLVFEAARGGDAVARGIVDRLADELALMASAIGRRLRVARADVDVVLAGGVFGARDPAFHARLSDGITGFIPRARITRLTERPVLGAVLLGLDALGVRPGGVPERRIRAELAAAEAHHTTMA